MSRAFITLFFILAIYSAGVLSQEGPRPCGGNEVWSPCNGHCPPTCVHPIPRCPRVCVPGCICKPGYLQNKKQECIPKDSCDPSKESSE